MIDKKLLIKLYLNSGKSALAISTILKCSPNKVNYWLDKHQIKKRSISDAIYLLKNPNGDPFKFNHPKSIERAILFGLGIGLYWGEGTKANKTSVRLGNTDPELIYFFINFLERIFSIKRNDLHFSLQIFSDMKEKDVLDFWIKKLRIGKSQFYKTTITPYRSIGNYRQKTKYGVLIVYYHNKKLRDKLLKLIECKEFLRK
jgi:hypothetical protein